MSPLRDALDRYITMRRGFGYKLRCEAYLLARFVAYPILRKAWFNVFSLMGRREVWKAGNTKPSGPVSS